MCDYVTTKDIAEKLGLTREYATDKVVKRDDFPKPAIVLSQKVKLWKLEDFDRWMAQRIKATSRHLT